VSRSVWARVAEVRPLLHHLTNRVAAPLQAEVALALGACPVMTSWPPEAGSVARGADGVLVNAGTPETEALAGQDEALAATEGTEIPRLLDLVGCGLSLPRTERLRTLLARHRFACVKGNGAEVAALAGRPALLRGVEGTTEVREEDLADLARRHRTLVLATGGTDRFADPRRTGRLAGGHEALRSLPGSGCALGTALLAALAAGVEPFEAAGAAVGLFAAASTRAASRGCGPGSFRVAFLDALGEARTGGLPLPEAEGTP